MQMLGTVQNLRRCPLSLEKTMRAREEWKTIFFRNGNVARRLDSVECGVISNGDGWGVIYKGGRERE